MKLTLIALVVSLVFFLAIAAYKAGKSVFE